MVTGQAVTHGPTYSTGAAEASHFQTRAQSDPAQILKSQQGSSLHNVTLVHHARHRALVNQLVKATNLCVHRR